MRAVAVVVFVLALALSNESVAQPASTSRPNVDVEAFAFAVSGAESDAAVSGELRLPQHGQQFPAVLILHSSSGFDGRGDFYAHALNHAGIATIEIDYMRGKGIPASPRDNLPHVFQTLKYLSSHARIDPARIGVMGFSWGGILALLTSSEELAHVHVGSPVRFAAHLGLYPICWRHLAIVNGESRWFDRTVYQRVTGSPVQIVSGGRDAFDDPDSCMKFVESLSPSVSKHFKYTIYPEATFGWDSRFGSATHDVGVNKGRGGVNRIVADPEIAAQSRALVVKFFGDALSLKGQQFRR